MRYAVPGVREVHACQYLLCIHFHMSTRMEQKDKNECPRWERLFHQTLGRVGLRLPMLVGRLEMAGDRIDVSEKKIP